LFCWEGGGDRVAEVTVCGRDKVVQPTRAREQK
jgi:hypothetical protein